MKEKEVNNNTTSFLRVWTRGRNFFNDKKTNDLDTAEILSKTLFNKPYSDLYTYEHNYVIQQLVKAGVN
jgi:hypothetical protein